MAAMDTTGMSEVDLDEETIRRARAQELEKYHHLPVHHLQVEKELRETVLPPTPVAQRHVLNGSGRGHSKEYPVDVGQPATLTVSEQRVIHQHVAEPTPGKKQKRVQIFSSFGRKGDRHVGDGQGHESDHHQTSNGAKWTSRLGQGHAADYDEAFTLTVYPNYLKRIPGFLRIAQVIVGIIVCAAVNAERCISAGLGNIVCGSASSPLWYGVLGGQGYVLFVGIIFILANLALIFYHLCYRPKSLSPNTHSEPLKRLHMTELAYDGLALLMYIIAAIVESWYASWTTLPIQSELVSAVVQAEVRNVYRPQWIAAAVFAWFNVVLYAIDLFYSFMFR